MGPVERKLRTENASSYIRTKLVLLCLKEAVLERRNVTGKDEDDNSGKRRELKRSAGEGTHWSQGSV